MNSNKEQELPFSEGEKRCLPVILSLGGGLLIGAIFGVGAWEMANSGNTGMAVFTAITAVACVILPPAAVQAGLWWANRPLRNPNPEGAGEQQDGDTPPREREQECRTP